MNKFSTAKNTKIEEAEDINIREIISEYLIHWKWFLFSVCVFIIIGTLVYLQKDRIFDVSTSILIKEGKGSSSSQVGSLGDLESLGLISTTNNIDNEVAVLSSPNLMKQVVDSLNLHTSYYINGFFRDTEIYTNCPYVVTLEDTDPKKLNGKITLKIKTSNIGVDISGTYEVGNSQVEIPSKTIGLPGNVDLPEGLGKLAIGYRSGYENSKDNPDYVVEIQNASAVAGGIASRIQINTTTKGSSVLRITLSVLNTTKGIDILNTIVKIYNANNVDENNEIAVNTARFIEDRLITINSELKGVEDKVVSFKTQQGITDLESEAQVFVGQTSSLEQNRIEIETQLKTIELIEGFTRNPQNKAKLIPNLVVNDPGLATLISEYNTSLLAYERLEKSTGESNPTRIKAQESLSNMREGIQLSINNVKNSINVSKRQLDKQLSKVSSKIRSLPTQQRELLEIMRQQQVKQSISLFLMQKLEETNLTMAATSDKAKVITDPLSSSGFVSPNRNTIFLAFFLIGLLIPVIVIFIKGKLQLSITGREELEKLSAVTVVGEIMKKEEDAVVVVGKDKTTPIVELFRTLRNNIKFILDEPDKKVVLVTSTIPGEGKTFVSINLSASFALSDKKVLLIGMDIRNPKLASEMNFRKGAGLSSYLSGSEPDWVSMLSSIQDFPNLSILQAGAIPPNPNELLMKPALSKLLQEAREQFDIIIIDSAPIGVVSDTFLISSLADATVYVTREGVTPKNAVSFINEVYADNKLPEMYLVLNDVEPSKNKGRYGRYGYGYTYGYGAVK